MSKIKKSKKLRRPNVPLSAPAAAAGSGNEPAAEAQPARSESPAMFDYTHIRKDLTRIGVLAGSLIGLLVILSFFIR